MIIIIKHGIYVVLLIILLLSTNTDARGGGRGGRGGSRGRGMSRGGGGLGWAFSSYSESSDNPYGHSFGTKGLPENSYLSNNDFRFENSKEFLISSLFYGAGLKNMDLEKARKYYKSVTFEDYFRSWNEHSDKEWRKTTRAPYFDNKLPDFLRVFPVSAVVGAATAFGLVTLLPLNVPPGKPLMYCGNTDLIQSQIRINNEFIYVCNNRKFETLCKRSPGSYRCSHQELQCDLKQGNSESIYCSQGTLYSKKYLFCSSTSTIQVKGSNENITIVNCFEGQLQKSRVSFIPTTTTTTESPFFASTTTPKPLSFNANFHIFLLKLMGKSEVVETALETTTPDSYPAKGDIYAWYPEALTIPPETTTLRPKPTTTKLPYVWMEKVYTYHDNGTIETTFRPVPMHLQPYSFEANPIILPNWYQIYTTSTEALKETSTEPTTTSTTEKPNIWMKKVLTDDLDATEKLVRVENYLVEIVEQLGPYIPSNWVKVSGNDEALETTTSNEW